jgi:type I restriction enzyme M protein
VRNFLAGRHVGATQDGELLEQVLLCVFARLVLADEGAHGPFDARLVRSEYLRALKRIRQEFGADFLPYALSLDAESLSYVDNNLALLDFENTPGDLVGDAYQCFVGADARGQDGQFFTPVVAVSALVAMVDPEPGEKIIDPACGAGGFLFATARHLCKKGVPARSIAHHVFGVDKDARLARIANVRLGLLTRQPSRIAVGDSLAWLSVERGSFVETHQGGDFDVVLTNPPFGARIVAASDGVRQKFVLARRWVARRGGALVPSGQLDGGTPPQVLFVERCVELVRPGGRIGMVVPESLVSGRNYRHVMHYILARTEVEAVVGMPEALFKTSGKGGTHTKTVLLVMRRRDDRRPYRPRPVFMAEATWCGHDSRGRSVPRDDMPTILQNYAVWRTRRQALTPSEFGFAVDTRRLRDDILAPRAYGLDLEASLGELDSTHHLLLISDLVSEGVLSICSGDEVGKLAYGTGPLPFIRTSDLANWELKADPKHGVSRELYEGLRLKQDVQPLDILMVRDGTYLIGTCAIITKLDTEIVFQSHLYKIRVNQSHMLDPFLLLAVLSSPVVQRQIRAYTQTQDIINSLGNRIHSIVLPVPRDEARRREISQMVESVISDRAHARLLAREAIGLVGRTTEGAG